MLGITDIRKLVREDEKYAFLRENPHLQGSLLLLGLGGSYAYGMQKESSDVDIRGIALNSKEEILLGRDFEEVVDVETDTTIYSLKKMVRLLLNNNPNTLEILGLKANQIVYTPTDRSFRSHVLGELMKLSESFLSKKVVQTFGGYANTQLRRLENKSARDIGEAQREAHILRSIEFAGEDFKQRYQKIDSDSLKLYVDTSDKKDHEAEIFIDVQVTHYPLRDFTGYINSLHSVVRDYDKIGKRNKKAIEHDKLGKHQAHLVRLYFMCFDILERHEVITRRPEIELLMKIRNGEYLKDDKTPKKEFYDLVDELESRLQRLAKETTLPEEPDYERIYSWLAKVSEEIVKGRH